MQLSHLLFRLAGLLLPLALASTTWLYLYPLFHGCAFPAPTSTSLPLHASRAPFRLLALGDPQLEGDSSLPDPHAPVFPSLQHVLADLRNANYDPPDVRAILLAAAQGAIKDAAAWLEGLRKTLDLWGNDWYLAHIVRTLRWWTEPSHVAVLGDLLGSQWVTDGEFSKRAGRYWGVVMAGMDKVPDETMGVWVESDHYDEPSGEERQARRSWGGTKEVLGSDWNWHRRVINIAGNHDIGYAGDIDEARVERFERAFGSVNWDMWLTLPYDNTSDSLINNNTSDSSIKDDDDNTNNNSNPPALRLVILNSMNLDTPAYTPSLQSDTYDFLNHIITTSRPVTDKTHATILLTHIPLHKPPGVCADSPYFDFFAGGSGVREQNMLSEHASKSILEGMFGLSGDDKAEGGGMGRRGIVVNGHDHVGCDVLHWIPQRSNDDETQINTPPLSDLPDVGAANDTSPLEPEPATPTWQARPYTSTPFTNPPPTPPHLREITLRSIMGDYQGHAGFLSAWFDTSLGESGEWVFEFASCGLGVQHWWWGVHILDLVLVGAVLGGVVACGVEGVGDGKGESRDGDGGGDGEEKDKVKDKDTINILQKEKVVRISVEPGARSLKDTRRV